MFGNEDNVFGNDGIFPGFMSGSTSTSYHVQEKNRDNATLSIVSDLYPVAAVIPAYQEGEYGEWSLINKDPQQIKGYFTTEQNTSNENPVLKCGEKVWMSVTPMEIESHLHHINMANGRVVVGGLGMGFYLHNICLKEDVTEIFVIEQNTDVIALFHKIAKPELWAGWDKVTIINGDIINDEFEENVVNADYLYVDIWPTLGGDEAEVDMCEICKYMKPKLAGFWGQELLITTYLEDVIGIYPWIADGLMIKQYTEDKKIPLFMDDHFNNRHYMRDYSTLCCITSANLGLI